VQNTEISNLEQRTFYLNYPTKQADGYKDEIVSSKIRKWRN